MDILLELADVLRTEGVGDCLALARVLIAIAGIEEPSLNGDECIVVVTARLISSPAATSLIISPGLTTSRSRCRDRIQ